MYRRLKPKVRLVNTIRALLHRRSILVRWPVGGTRSNFGDKLNPYLVERIAKTKVFNVNEVVNILRRPEYSVIGSGLGSSRLRGSIVWGTGFISYSKRLKSKPRKVCAVRGPLTRRKLMEENIYCPEVYGDPALLLPRYLSVAGRIREQIGFAPHFRDANLELVDQARRSKEVKFLDVTADIDAFVQELGSCECVIASSLHALIVADAYGIPSLWVRLSDNPRGDLFKFQDYYQSIGLGSMKPHEAGSIVELVRLAARCEMHELKIDMEALYQSCPFRANPADEGS